MACPYSDESPIYDDDPDGDLFDPPARMHAFRCMECGEADEDEIPRALCSRCQWLAWQEDLDE